MAKVIHIDSVIGNREGEGKRYERIDRGSRWGNPYVIGVDGNREQVIRLFEEYARFRVKQQPHWLDRLVGKDLACWCAPLKCHGDILLELISNIYAKGTDIFVVNKVC